MNEEQEWENWEKWYYLILFTVIIGILLIIVYFRWDEIVRLFT